MKSIPAKKIEPAKTMGKTPDCAICKKTGVALSDKGFCKECQDTEKKLAEEQKKISKMSMIGMFKALFREKFFRFEKQLSNGITELDKGQGYKATVPEYQMRTALSKVEIELEQKRYQLKDIKFSDEDIKKLEEEVKEEEK